MFIKTPICRDRKTICKKCFSSSYTTHRKYMRSSRNAFIFTRREHHFNLYPVLFLEYILQTAYIILFPDRHYACANRTYAPLKRARAFKGCLADKESKMSNASTERQNARQRGWDEFTDDFSCNSSWSRASLRALAYSSQLFTQRSLARCLATRKPRCRQLFARQIAT